MPSQTFANKLTAAVATIITGGVLTFVGYDVAAEKAATEAHKVVEIAVSQATVSGMWKASFIVPIIGQLLAIGFLFAYNLRDKDVQIMSDCNAGKITKAEAEALLSQKILIGGRIP